MCVGGAEGGGERERDGGVPMSSRKQGLCKFHSFADF